MKVTAGINGMKMMGKVPGALRRIWQWYMSACTIFITLAILHVCNLVLDFRYGYAALPNGTRLVITEWFDFSNAVALKNSNGDIVVPPNIGEVTWNDKYVMGWRWVAGKGDFHFIYKVGSPGAAESRGNTAEEYRRLRAESGLKSSVELGYNYSTSTYQNYLDLMQNREYRRSWYE